MAQNIKVKFVDLALHFNSLKSEIVERLLSTLESGDYILGKEVQVFESLMSEYCGCKYAVGVGNGTDAIFLSLKALGINSGDEVITSPNSFIATAGAIVAAGAKPVFVDVGEDYNIEHSLIEKAVNKKTKAIIPVHLNGRPAEMKPILDVAKKYNLAVIEDAAQAIGSKYWGRKVGSFGNAGCFSLHPLKNLNCCGDGGAITTNDESLHEKLLHLRNHGLKNRDESVIWGYNSRLDSIQAAILNVRIKYLKSVMARINEIVKMYREGIRNYVKVPIDKEYEEIFYHNFVIEAEKRDELQSFLLQKGIETKIHYPIPIHLQPQAMAMGYKQGDFPMAEAQAKKILSLPLYHGLKNEQVIMVINAIKSFCKG